jgi:pimeloyl-ACP methyl ester carboxylesterase
MKKNHVTLVKNMKQLLTILLLVLPYICSPVTFGQVSGKVVDLPTRPGVTQRFFYLSPENSKASVILFSGANGGLDLSDNGDIRSGKGNFLVRSRQILADSGLAVAIIDAPSDRQREPFLLGFRQTSEHVADVKAVIAWLKQQTKIPVWLIGTSRGTQSAAFVATELALPDGGPDGLVLTSTMLDDSKGRPVPAMPLEKITIPVLVVHHEQDGCKYCSYSDIPLLMNKLSATQRKELLSFKGGKNRGDACEAFAYHGFNGLEEEVIKKIVSWIISR